MTDDELIEARSLCSRALQQGLSVAERTRSYELMELLLDDYERLRHDRDRWKLRAESEAIRG